MEETDPQELLALASEAAVAAGELLRERFEAGPERNVVSKTTPTDLVSDADLASQRAIRALIGSRRPDDGFLGEEDGADVRGSSGLQWVVDPLDGTINFLFGIPHWCVSVAANDPRGTLVGVVHDPIAGETFTAVRGERSELDGVAIDTAAGRGGTLAEALVATGFAYDAGVRAAQGEVLARLIGSVRDIRRAGSAALDLAWTATRRCDAFYERGVKPWDIAAGVLLCQSAGLQARELEPRGHLPSGIAVAPPSLLEPLLALVG
ncbi:MAG: inositol monophosphatase family protein [Solirubrobacteraceae bacterium]|jgi:myo-inositol-1(or 4)-monophosphatase